MEIRNALVIGKSPIAAEQLSVFCDKVIIAIDNSFMSYRHLPEYEKYDILQSNVDMSTAKSIFRKTLEIRKWIRDYRVSIIYTNTKWDMVAAKFASIFSKENVILISTSHNSYAWLDERKVRFMSMLIRCTTHYYIALASFVYNKLRRLGLDENRLLLLPNTVSSDDWRIKDDYTIESYVRIVYVANVYEGKGQDFLLEILRRYNGSYKLQIDCYGDLLRENQEYIDRIHMDASKLKSKGAFTLKGRIENAQLRDLLCNYDMYISPSRMEMSPVNILEAFAAGVPVIAADVGGVSDIVYNNKTGLLYNVDQVEDAIDKINMLINSKELRKSIGQSGRKFVSEVYTRNTAGQNIKEIIEK